MCFHGEPKYIYKIDDHFIDGKNNLGKYALTHFDLDWNYIDVRVGNHEVNPTAEKPKRLDEMICISRLLSKDFSFVRCDFLETEKNLYLSELTFAPHAGLKKYQPAEFDFILGRLWNFPQR